MNLPKHLKYISLVALILVSSSCARYEGMSNCEFYPLIDHNVTLSNSRYFASLPNQALTPQYERIMGYQGVTECDFTGL